MRGIRDTRHLREEMSKIFDIIMAPDSTAGAIIQSYGGSRPGLIDPTFDEEAEAACFDRSVDEAIRNFDEAVKLM